MQYKYKISVIIPVYNVKEYLKTAIESVIKQSIGFKYIQLILIDDGSTDGSDKICLKYEKEYPNIIYIKQKNSGVSIARNQGLEKATGKYINFLDSDDRWSKNAFKAAYKFMEKNIEVNFCCLKMRYFGKVNTKHYLNYKFKKDSIINIYENYNFIQTTVTSTFIRNSAIKNIRFDNELKYAEDGKFINELIFNDQKYGIVKNGCYYYRKRENETSAVQKKGSSINFFKTVPKGFYLYFINKNINKYNKVLKYYQYLIFNDIKWALNMQIDPIIPEKIKKDFFKDLHYVLKYIDNEIIDDFFKNNFDLKLFTYKLKYDHNNFILNNGKVIYQNQVITEINNFVNNIEIFEKNNNNLIVEGNIADFNNCLLYYKANNIYTKINTFPRYDKEKTVNNIVNTKRKGYQIKINLLEIQNIEFYIEINGQKYKTTNNFIGFTRLNNYKAGYYYDKGYLFTKNKTKDKIIIKHTHNYLLLFYLQIRFLLYLLFIQKQLKSTIIRMLYYITKPFIPKNIWIISDRKFMAKDSGEMMFKYIQNHQVKNTHPYFAVDSNSKDYIRLQKIGKVLAYNSLKYKLYFLNSKLIISSHFDIYVSNEFGNRRKYYADLYRFKYIYLTHGILLHDSSKLLNKYNKNIKLNVATGIEEYKSITKEKYYYFDNELKLTGLPRYDNLFLNDKVENKILFMPSWRSKLAGTVIPGTQNRLYNKKFKNSEYYKFYNKLLNDNKLLNKCREKKYKIKFCVHPSFRSQFKDFTSNDIVEFAIDVDSQYETRSSKFLITDYSSAACDFAYLRKPVIYANFDLDHIYDYHYYNKGYFDYNKDGFGPNCTDYETTLNEIIKCIDNDGVIENKYKERDNKFFKYNDNKNCARVYNEILKIIK